MPTFTSQPAEAAAIDTYINEAVPDATNTTASTVDTRDITPNRRNVFFKPDLSMLVGLTLTSFTFSLWNSSTSASNRTFEFNAILVANSGWIEACSWNFANGATGTLRWAGDTGADGGTDAGCSVSGTDYNASLLGSLTYVADTVVDTKHSVAFDVAQMQAMIAANHGFIMRRTDSGATFSFRSSTATSSLVRPEFVAVTAGGGSFIYRLSPLRIWNLRR